MEPMVDGNEAYAEAVQKELSYRDLRLLHVVGDKQAEAWALEESKRRMASLDRAFSFACSVGVKKV